MAYEDVLAATVLRLPPRESRVLTCLAWHKNGETGRCFPSLETMSEWCVMSRTSVKLATIELTRLGMLRKKRGRYSIEYDLCLEQLRRTESDSLESRRTESDPEKDGIRLSEGRNPTPNQGSNQGIEPKTKPDAAPQLVLASASLSKVEKQAAWTEADVEDLWKVFPKEYRGDKKPACKSIRAALTDLQGQGFDLPAEVLKERVRNWFADYEVKQKAARLTKTFLKHPGHAQGWFNPKTRCRYMSDEALVPVAEKPQDVNPLDAILAQQALALAEKQETEVTFASANAA